MQVTQLIQYFIIHVLFNLYVYMTIIKIVKYNNGMLAILYSHCSYFNSISNDKK